MSNVSRKLHSRRRLAALTFLSNISLDGTHRDTNLGDLTFNLKSNNVSKNGGCLSKPKEISTVSCEPAESVDTKEDFKQHFKIKSSTDDEKLKRKSSEHKERSDCGRKDRVHKFVVEAKARLYNLSQKRRLSYQSVELHALPSVTSTESLVPGLTWSRKPSLCPSEGSFPQSTEIKFVRNFREHRNDAERMIIVSKSKLPFVVFSVLPYSKLQASSKSENKIELNRRRHASVKQLAVISDGPDPFDLLFMLGMQKPQEGQNISYGPLLTPSNPTKMAKSHDHSESSFRFPHQVYTNECLIDHVNRMASNRSATPPKSAEKHSTRGELMSSSSYHPNLLDDPELIAGKHSTLLVFSSYVTSVIDYVKPSDLKKDLNERFRERFPHIQLTLSKLRSLKREMCKIAKHECNLDLLIVAQAFVYYEKLILKNLINKHNRKHCAGACILLSAKMNDVRGNEMKNLLEKIEAVFRISRREMMGLEFGVLVALEFSLLLNSAEILPHYQRLLYES